MVMLRHFRCDCGTARLPIPCRLADKDVTVSNDENVYDHNFEGKFCTCNVPVPHTDYNDYDMAQCMFCEDWFHLAVRIN